MTPAINGDLSVPVVVDTQAMDWSASPSGSVWRKRVHLVGPPESGQVTSVVRYEPASTFPAHDHPAGEEILVLDGVFSDEHGDWRKGSYLLNPEGFRHAPFSREGCLLFVKLRQLTFGYSFPRAWFNKTPIQNLSLSFVGRNLWVINKNIDNVDPESTYSTNAGAQGLEYFAMPVTRSYGFNLRVTF